MKRKLSKALSVILTTVTVISAIIIAPVTVSAANTADSIVDIARAEIGNSYYQKYNGHKDAWCADFVTWCAKQAGVSSIASSSSCYNMYMGMKDSCERVYSPQKGDIVFFYCNKCSSTSGKWCHVGIMEDSTYSIEGNNWSDGTSKVQRGKSYNHNGDLGYRHGDSSGCITRIYLRPNYDNSSIDKPKDNYVDIGTDFYAYVEHKSTGMYLTNQKTNAAGETPNGTSNQIWKFVRQANGAYSIQSVLNGYYLDVYGPYDDDNVNVYTWPEYTGGSNQQFYIYYQYGAYSFRPAHSYSRRLDMSSTEGHNLALWGAGEDWAPQKFDIIKIDSFGSLPVDIGTDFYAYVEHKSTGMYLTNQKRNAAGETQNGTSNQIWKFVRQANGAYSIQSVLNGYYLDVYGPYDDDNVNVYTWPEYTGGSNQQFYIYYQYGAYSFRPAHSYSRRLDMSSTEGHNLALWGAGEDWAPQKFDIIKTTSITHPTISLNKKNYNLDEKVAVSASADGGVDYYGVQVWKGDKVVYQESFTGNKLDIDCSKLGAGDYGVFVSCVNNYGSINTETIQFHVTSGITNDIDLDNSVTVADATLLQKYVVGIATLADDQKLLADCNGDGKVDVKDATYIQKTVVKLSA